MQRIRFISSLPASGVAPLLVCRSKGAILLPLGRCFLVRAIKQVAKSFEVKVIPFSQVSSVGCCLPGTPCASKAQGWLSPRQSYTHACSAVVSPFPSDLLHAGVDLCFFRRSDTIKVTVIATSAITMPPPGQVNIITWLKAIPPLVPDAEALTPVHAELARTVQSICLHRVLSHRLHRLWLSAIILLFLCSIESLANQAEAIRGVSRFSQAQMASISPTTSLAILCNVCR